MNNNSDKGLVFMLEGYIFKTQHQHFCRGKEKYPLAPKPSMPFPSPPSLTPFTTKK
jgi:hypothetical protein